MIRAMKEGVRSAWASSSGREMISTKVGKFVESIASATKRMSLWLRNSVG